MTLWDSAKSQWYVLYVFTGDLCNTKTKKNTSTIIMEPLGLMFSLFTMFCCIEAKRQADITKQM